HRHVRPPHRPRSEGQRLRRRVRRVRRRPRDARAHRARRLPLVHWRPVSRTARTLSCMPANPLNTDDFGGELYNLAMSEGARPLLDKVKSFIADEVDPITAEFFALGEGRAERWSFAPGQLELL